MSSDSSNQTMKHESVIDLLNHLYKTYPYSMARWVKDNSELHITLVDFDSLSGTIKEEET